MSRVPPRTVAKRGWHNPLVYCPACDSVLT
jgi:hypothetical protein